MRFITFDDFSSHLHWKDAVEALIEGHRLPKAEIADSFLGSDKATLLNRSSFVPGLGYGVKAVTVMDDNPKHNLPTVQGGMFFFDHEWGKLQAVLDTSLITNIKTAADSVCGASFLARPDSRHLLIMGGGNMASFVAKAYDEVFPDLETIMIWSRRPEQAKNLASKLSHLNATVEAVEEPDKACAKADIITTVTMARQPILKGEWVREGTHIDLIGAYKANMREADDALLKKGHIFVDSRETTIQHIGELMQPLKAGVIRESDIIGDLYDIVGGRCGRKNAEEITIYKNGGGAHLDTMIAAYIIKKLS